MYEKEKQKLKALIDDFKSRHKQYTQMSEADIETKLVEELFVNILGWSKNDFIKQAAAHRGESRGRADYAFYINDKIVFFLEVKKVGIPLSKEADKQVRSYASSKRVPFAVSTNFEEMKVFCVEAESEDKRLLIPKFISPDSYLEKFDDLWLLSKESLKKDLLYKRAISLEFLKKRISVDKILLQDLMYIRKEIASDIEKTYKTKFTIEEKDEIVQRIIDRLIFIRCCEDKGINPEDLRLYDITNEVDSKAYPKLKLIFTKYNEVYNSGLFAPNKDNDCDNIELNGGIIKKLVKLLYDSKNDDFVYNFEWISADVLGQVYEQYLGMILAQTKSGNAKLKEGQAHKKEQGIYYTPTYIVEYIVKNTVGELLKDKKIKPKDIKILDPACGSGSFLIQAFDVLNENLSQTDEYKQRKIDGRGMYSLKTDIIKNNIYGVDLDNKAVEITKLSLLLKASEKDRKLPSEEYIHIKHGNSLIDDPAIAGTAAFKWEDQFKDVIDNGGFDVVIGNPPYVNIFNLPELERNYFQKQYKTATNKSDLYAFFVEKVIIKLLRKDGYLGFIISNTWTSIQSFESLRKFILENTMVDRIVPLELGIFPDANVVPIILIVKKTTDKQAILKNKIKIFKFENNLFKLDKEIPQKTFLESKGHIFSFSRNQESKSIFDKINKNIILLGDIASFSLGIKSSDNDKFVSLSKSNESYKKIIKGRNIKRYNFDHQNEWIWYNPSEMMKRKGAGPRKPEYFEVPKKIILQEISSDKIIATLDIEQYYALDTVNIIYELDKAYEMEYILGLLNSKLINFWYGSQFKGLHVKLNELRQIPIKKMILKEQQPIIELVDKMLSLNKQLQSFGDKQTSESAKIQEEIKRTDEKIDQLVYKLYDLTPEEIKIVEESK